MACRSILSFTRRAAASQLGQALLVIHLALAVYAIAHEAPTDDRRLLPDCQVITTAGRAVSIHREGPLLKTIALLDPPSSFVLTAITPVGLLPTLLTGFPPSFEGFSLLRAVTLFILAGVQWWVTGFLIQSIVRRHRTSRR